MEIGKIDKVNGDLTPPSYSVIDTSTAMEGNASVKIAKIKKYQEVHIDFTPPDVSDEYDGGNYQGYILSLIHI